VYLEGELGDKFGHFFQINADRPAEVFQCLDGNFSDFRKYLIDCEEKGIGFLVEVGGIAIEEEKKLLLNLEEGDILITPVPAGSKSGFGKILAAVALASLFLIPGGNLYVSATLAAKTGATVGYTNLGLFTASIAANLALTGFQQLMVPDPSVDSQEDESYLFNGPEQSIIEGDPIPVLYGKLRVPGQPISFEVINKTLTTGSSQQSNVIVPFNPETIKYTGLDDNVDLNIPSISLSALTTYKPQGLSS
jgi:predicted phage tail protein